MRAVCLILAVFTTLLFSCSDKGKKTLLPDSGGQPYDVVVVGDRDSIVYQYLSQDTPGLPQPEPMFDVTEIADLDKLPSARLARNIIRVDINPEVYTSFSIDYSKNINAEPQIEIRLHAPSVSILKEAIENDNRLASLIDIVELNRAISVLKRKNNPKADATVRKIFGCTMYVPADMTSSKVGRNFVWFSNNATTGMQNICVFTIPECPLQRLAEKCDSVTKINIPGECDGMYFSIDKEHFRLFHLSAIPSSTVQATGLWEMKDDIMGGPVRLHFIKNKVPGKIVVAMAFVYAPEMSKRNEIKAIEAALYTLKPDPVQERNKKRNYQQ